jgi:hypothetical protein
VSHGLEADLEYSWVSEFVGDSFTLCLVASFMDVEVVRSEYFFPSDFSLFQSAACCSVKSLAEAYLIFSRAAPVQNPQEFTP